MNVNVNSSECESKSLSIVDFMKSSGTISTYFNGHLSSSVSTSRFLSYTDQSFTFGKTPLQKYPFHGRFYYLMVSFPQSLYGITQ